MVGKLCKLMVKQELQKMGLHFIVVDLGEIEIMETLSKVQHDELMTNLQLIGLELVDDKRSILIERIKGVIVEMVHLADEMPNITFSNYLSQKLQHDYTYMANLFSSVQGITIEQFIILHKVERIKELIMYGELNLTEISYKLNYSSVAHLSNQFKKVTGLTPTHFKNLKDKRRTALEEIGIKTEAHE